MFPRFARTALMFLGFFSLINGCKETRTGGSPDSYVENGVLWAYGSVQLADLDAPGGVMLKRTAPDQPLDTYQMFGSVHATDIGGGERDLAYVDLHPTSDKVLAYAYQLSFVKHGYTNDVIDVYAILRKAGRSDECRQKVYLGTANFANGSNFATVSLAEGLKLSLIANGVFSGQWALHFPEIKKVVVKPWAGMCPKVVTQMPGQTPGQNPGQFDSCRPMPAQNDLCNGDPTKEGCRPAPPVQAPPANAGGSAAAPVEPAKAVTGLEVISADEQVYFMNADVPEAKIVFTSETLKAASEEENTALCTSKFYAVARTVGRQVNSSCVLKPAPAEFADGKLTCALTVSFDRAETYLERICDVTALFRGEPDEVQHVQVLKK